MNVFVVLDYKPINSGTRYQQNKVIRITAIMFITKPAFTIWLNLI